MLKQKLMHGWVLSASGAFLRLRLRDALGLG